MKSNKKCQESICEHKVSFFNVNSTPPIRDVTCSELKRYGENIGDKKLWVEHTHLAL